jgi:hypothetical protein
MGNTWFDYFFLTENCSYQLLPLLEAADPSLDLSGRFHVKVIPVDTIRAVQSVPGLVKERVLRPSAVRMLMTRRALLSPREAGQAAALAAHPADDSFLKSLPEERRALVLDSAYDRMRLRHHFVRYPSPEQEKAEHALLLLRRESPVASPDVGEQAKEGASPPEESHATGRIGLGGGRSAGHGFTELSLRGAMHDTEDDQAGYIAGSRLEMFHLRLRYGEDPGKLSVRRGTLVDIMSLSPLDRWIRYHSWKFFMGFDAPLDRPVAPGGGLMFRLNGGTGFTWGEKEGRLLAYALIGADGGLGGTLDHSYRLGWEGDTGLLCRLGRRWRWHGDAFHRRYFAGEAKSLDGLSSTLSLSLGGPWETRFTAVREGRRKEFSFIINRYL